MLRSPFPTFCTPVLDALRKLRAKKKDLCRVVDPDQQEDQRGGGPIGGSLRLAPQTLPEPVWQSQGAGREIPRAQLLFTGKVPALAILLVHWSCGAKDYPLATRKHAPKLISSTAQVA
jgi:hypothetical protein